MKIRWSQHAYNSLTDVLDYSLETFGFLQQVAIEDIIMTSIDKLAEFPTMCPIIPEISNNVREYRNLLFQRRFLSFIGLKMIISMYPSFGIHVAHFTISITFSRIDSLRHKPYVTR